MDDVIFLDKKNGVPNEVSVADKVALELLQFINELSDKGKNILLKLIETFVSKKYFKDYLQKNTSTLQREKLGMLWAFLFSFYRGLSPLLMFDEITIFDKPSVLILPYGSREMLQSTHSKVAITPPF